MYRKWMDGVLTGIIEMRTWAIGGLQFKIISHLISSIVLKPTGMQPHRRNINANFFQTKYGQLMITISRAHCIRPMVRNKNVEIFYRKSKNASASSVNQDKNNCLEVRKWNEMNFISLFRIYSNAHVVMGFCDLICHLKKKWCHFAFHGVIRSLGSRMIKPEGVKKEWKLL